MRKGFLCCTVLAQQTVQEETKTPAYDRTLNGGCARRGKILSEQHKRGNKMDARMQELRIKKKRERHESWKLNPGTLLET